MKPKILIFDIENAPSVSYIWQLKNDYIPPAMLKSEWYMLCWAAKWLGQKTVMSSALCDYKNYDPRNPCDKDILAGLWELLNEADIVIAHNGAKFDVKKSNARFVKHGMKPPSPFRVIDTLVEARKQFMFTANSLNELGKFLDAGRKIRTGGFDLWLDVMAGDRKAWSKMVHYCKNDVILLEKVYLKLRPYMKNHPNLSVITEYPECSRCGSKNLQRRGFIFNQAAKKQRYQCQDCGGWGSDKNGTRNA